MEAAARSSYQQARRSKKRPGAAAAVGIEAASHIRRAKPPPRKRPRSTTAAQIDVLAVGIEASASCTRRSTAQIGIPSRRAKTVRPHPVSNPDPNWVVRRARSPRDLVTNKLQPLPRPNRVHPWRDWSDLGDGPAGLIAERVLAYDVADYVRFRAVCRPWRQCSADPPAHSGLDRRFHPWRWTMLREKLAAPERRCFLNTSTAECIQVDIPELRDHKLLALTPEGLLVLVHKRQRATVCLLNPLTRHLTELPPLTTLLPPESHNRLSEDYIYFDGEFKAWGSGIANDDSTFVVCFNKLHIIGMAKPGDDHWKMLKYRGDGMTAAPLMFAGRLYCVILSGVMVLEMGADQPPQLKVAAKLSMHVSPIADSVHLVNNCGELILVHRRSGPLTARNKSGRFYDAYRVDLDTRTLFPVKSLGGCAVFMGLYCSLSVPLEVFPSGSISADTIYPSFDLRERKTGAYHLAGGDFDLICRRDWSDLEDVPTGGVRWARSPRDLVDGSTNKLQPLPRPNRVHPWRDWSALGDGPAGLIAERVLAYDVADYLRFRAVCRPWRQSSTEPRTHSGLDRRFHPWRWTMLRDELAVPDSRCFINTSTSECVKVDIPELNDYELLALTPEGLLVLADKPPSTTTICLLNPLTRYLVQLPPLSTLVPSEDHDDMLPERDGLSLEYFTAWGSGIANDDSTFVLCFHQLSMLGMAKPGDDHWTLVGYDGHGMTTAPIMFEGRFYCVNFSGVMVLEMGPPRLEVAAKLNMHVWVMADTFHLVNNCGELMLVHCHSGWKKSGQSYDMYRVDLDTGTLLPVKSLGGAGRALFLGMLCSLSVSLEVFPSGSISVETIYLSFDMYERVLLKVGAYHLADGSVQVPCTLVQPHTLVDCLSLSNTVS